MYCKIGSSREDMYEGECRLGAPLESLGEALMLDEDMIYGSVSKGCWKRELLERRRVK